MKKFMVVIKNEDRQSACFFNKYADANNCRMNCECGIGGYAEIYEYAKDEESGISSYVLID